jgi:zinc/manganese transport system ATP-binding protein
LSAIELESVTISVGGRPVFRDVDLEVGDAEFVGVLGPNGAGKTTLLRAILGLVKPSSGTIRVLGQPAERGNPLVGYIPQVRSTAGGRWLRSWEFVASAAYGHRWGWPWPNAALRRDVDRALDTVGARSFGQRPLAELSGGERQRLLLAQALLGKPRLLLLDEPLISLDPHHQRDVVALARDIQRELEITVLFSAHELNPLLDALDRVLYLGNGHAALGTVEDVITGPSLSRLYGSEIEVLRHNGRIFVMSGSLDLGRHEHQHHV